MGKDVDGAPKSCREFYIPWVCGTCPVKAGCKPHPAPLNREQAAPASRKQGKGKDRIWSR